jgi:hypothetical protein
LELYSAYRVQTDRKAGFDGHIKTIKVLLYKYTGLKGAAPRFLDTKYFSFSVFKTDNVSHFDLKSKI